MQVQASCGRKDPRKPSAKAAVSMAQSRCKSRRLPSGKTKRRAGVGAKTRSAGRPREPLSTEGAQAPSSRAGKKYKLHRINMQPEDR